MCVVFAGLLVAATGGFIRMNAIPKGSSRNSGYDRATNDWYIEPSRAIDELLDVESFDGPIWDPACGSGNIPIACKRRGYETFASDIVDRGYPDAEQVDFLSIQTERSWNVISNPPYNLAEEFVIHALNLGAPKVAMLVRLAFLEGRGRHERLFKLHPPARIWQFISRISMPPGGVVVEAKGGSVAFCWIVWECEHVGAPRFGWLP